MNKKIELHQIKKTFLEKKKLTFFIYYMNIRIYLVRFTYIFRFFIFRIFCVSDQNILTYPSIIHLKF